MALVRLFAVGLITLTIVYCSVAWFVRSICRERLEREWDAANPDGDPETRRAAVDEGVRVFRATLAYRGLWLIYALPAIFLTSLLVVNNWN